MAGVEKHSAPGPYLGFALQPVRLCFHLLSAPVESSVSLEVLDDVAIHYADGTLRFEQCKSALFHNALSDWSEDIWKVFALFDRIINRTSGRLQIVVLDHAGEEVWGELPNVHQVEEWRGKGLVPTRW